MLTFDHVTKIYDKGKKAVDDLHLEVKNGEFVVFIGPSGCGKTTTMKMVNRLIEPSEGSINIEGEDIMNKNAVELRRSIGYVIQQIGLFPHMTIGQNIALVPKLVKWPEKKRRERTEELLKLVGMPTEFLDRYPNELSGGQQQRIGVLRALAADPPLILMDEPFGALDPITRDALQTEFKKLQQSLGKTIVFVTHDMDEAIKLADRIVIMRDGKLEQVGTPDEILQEPANDFVREFIGKERLLQARPNVQSVEQIMDTKPATTTKSHTLAEAVEYMKNRRVDSLMVIDEANKLEGFIDIKMIEQNWEKARVVADAFEPDVYVVETGTLLRKAIQEILREGIKNAPVIDHENRLQGILTRASLVNIVYDALWSEADKTDESEEKEAETQY